MTFVRPFLAAAFTLLAGLAQATTISEADYGEFSNDFRAPSVIENGTTIVSGVWSVGGDYDLIALTGMAPGAQKVTLSFKPLSPIGPMDWGFAAGGVVNYKTAPFQWSAWEGKTLARVGIDHANRNGLFDYELDLGEDFAGQLYLGLMGTHGSLAYTITAPGNAAPTVAPQISAPAPAPAPVPLPAGAPLLMAGLAALAMLRLRRKRA
jgi:hypothetical protein